MKTTLSIVLSVLFLFGCTTQQNSVEIRAQQRVTGLFQYMADAPLITLCSTGKRYPVAMEEGYIELERAYLNSGVEPGSMAWVQIKGQLGERPAMEGEGKRAYFIVHQFESIETGRQCATKEALQLQGQQWQLSEIPGSGLKIPKDNPPTLYFDHKRQRVTGFAACNRFFGGYQLDAARLEIGPLGSTRMSCGDADLLENAFLKRLNQVKRWQIIDQKLSLINDNQVLLILAVE